MAAGGDAARCPEIPGRCHHCAGPLSKDMETSSWTVPPMVRDSFSMIGSAVGGIAGAFYGFNHIATFAQASENSWVRHCRSSYHLCNSMPVVRRYIKGPMWMHFLVGTPPVIVFSSACAGLAGGTIPAAAQLVSSSYHAAMSLPSFARSSHATEPSQSFARSAPHDDMHKARSSSPL